MEGQGTREISLNRRIARLAGPSMMDHALQTVVQYADTAMVGALGAGASAAVGLTTTMTWLINSPLMAAGIGVLACIAKCMPFVISLGCMWGVRIAFTVLCVNVFHLGLNAVWVCMVADNVLRCALLMLRFWRGGWKRGLVSQALADAPQSEA